jgi:hypothetical protein
MRLHPYNLAFTNDFSGADNVVILHCHGEVHMRMLRER